MRREAPEKKRQDEKRLIRHPLLAVRHARACKTKTQAKRGGEKDDQNASHTAPKRSR